MNTAARRMFAAASASSGQGMALESECALEGFDRPVGAERSFDAAAEPFVPTALPDGGIELIQRICRDMQAQGEACVLLTGTAPGFAPARFHPAYAPARINGSSFSWTLKDELEGTGVTAICVLPGLADTDLFGRHDEPIARVAADVSYAWNRLQAAVATVVLWATSMLGLDRTRAAGLDQSVSRCHQLRTRSANVSKSCG